MVLTKKKAGKAFKKILIGAKKGFKETSAYVKKHGPGFNQGMGKVAASIQEGFAVRPRRGFAQ